MLPIAILSGGLATRLRPLTEKVPKALIEVAGRPFVDWQLELLAERGVREVVLCVGFLGEMLQAHVGDGSRYGLTVEFSNDGDLLQGTGGAIRKALPMLGSHFFVLYGDSFLPIDYEAVEQSWRTSGRSGLMTVFRNEGRWDTSNVEFREGVLIRYDKSKKSPQMGFIDYGLSILSAESFRDWKDETPLDLADILREEVRAQRMGGLEIAQRFYEIGSLAGIADLETFLDTSSLPPSC